MKFGSDGKLKGTRSFTPGPGNYDHKQYLGNDGKKITITGKASLNKSLSDFPGPGAYQPKIETFKPTAKGFKIFNPSRSGKDFRKDLPGPGHYKPKNHTLSNIKHVPKWSMGNKNPNYGLYARLEKIHGEIPAPGNYDLNRSIGEGPKVINYSFIYLFICLFVYLFI